MVVVALRRPLHLVAVAVAERDDLAADRERRQERAEPRERALLARRAAFLARDHAGGDGRVAEVVDGEPVRAGLGRELERDRLQAFEVAVARFVPCATARSVGGVAYSE